MLFGINTDLYNNKNILKIIEETNNITDNYNNNFLHYIIFHNKKDLFNKYKITEKDFLHKNIENISPFDIAVINNYTYYIYYCIDKLKINIDLNNKIGLDTYPYFSGNSTIIDEIINRCSISIIKYFINTFDKFQHYIFLKYIQEKRKKYNRMIIYFLENLKIDNINKECNCGNKSCDNFPLIISSINAHNYDIIKYLIDKKGININFIYKNKTFLYYLCRYNHYHSSFFYDCLYYLLNKGCDYTSGDFYYCLIKYAPSDIFLSIINNYPMDNINLTDNCGYNLLHHIISSNNTNKIPIINYLINKGIDINIPTEQGLTPLIIAGGYINNFEIVKLLINNGADYNYINKHNISLYVVLSMFNNLEFMKYLDRFYKIGIEHKKLAFECAILYNNTDIIKYLLLDYNKFNNIIINEMPLKLYCSLNCNKKIKNLIYKYDNNIIYKTIKYNDLEDKECLISSKNINIGDEIFICKYNHIYLFDEFKKWYINKQKNECIYCSNKLFENCYYKVVQ